MPAEFSGRRKRVAALLAASAAVAGAVSAQRTNAATINGTVAAGEYPAGAIATQNTPTGFGDNFSELNQAFASYTPGGNLELALTANLEGNGNGLVLFIDSKTGGGIANPVLGGFNQFGSISGQRSDNWGTDINGAAGVTAPPGGASVLAPAFNPDYAIEINSSGGASYFINVIDLTLPNSPSANRDVFIGSGTVNSGAAVTHTYLRDGGATDSGDVTSAFDNTNTAGVTDASAANAATATKGFEFIFEGQFLANTPGHALRVLPFITSSDGAFLSNQFLPGLGGIANPGAANEPAGTPLFDSRAFSDRFYLDLFVPTLTGLNWYTDTWTGGVAPNGVEHAARLTASTTAYNFGVTGATLGYLELTGASLEGGGTLNFNGGSGAAVLFSNDGVNTLNATVNVQTDLRINVAAGSVSFGSMSMAAGKRLTKVGAGALTIGAGNSNGANVAIDVQAGAFTANVDLGAGLAATTTAPDITVGLAAGGSPATASFGASQTLRSLIIHPGATVNVLPHGARAIVANTLALSGNAKIDLANNNMVLKAMSLGTASAGVYNGVHGLVQQAFNAGAWDGAGITTSHADALGGLTTLGVASGEQIRGLGPADTDVWNGLTIQGSDTVVMYTYAGDANLDGAITGDDYSTIDFSIAVPGADGYYNGDFNYDGIISGDDYSVIDFNIVAQGAPLSDASPASVSAVPEPSVGAGVVSLFAATAMRCRLRRKGAACTRHDPSRP